jgi:hypothetical protein
MRIPPRKGEIRSACEVLVRKPEGKRLPERYKGRLEDNIKMDLNETEWKGVNWIHLDQDGVHCRVLVNMVMNIRVP